MKKATSRLIIAAASLVSVLAMSIGATYAWFTTNWNNDVAIGTLSVESVTSAELIVANASGITTFDPTTHTPSSVADTGLKPTAGTSISSVGDKNTLTASSDITDFTTTTKYTDTGVIVTSTVWLYNLTESQITAKLALTYTTSGALANAIGVAVFTDDTSKVFNGILNSGASAAESGASKELAPSISITKGSPVKVTVFIWLDGPAAVDTHSNMTFSGTLSYTKNA